MADLSTCCTAVANAISGVTGLGRVYDQFVSQVVPPCAVVTPANGQVMRFDTMDGGMTFFLRIILLVPFTQDSSMVSLLNSWLAPTGAASIAAALRANPRLNSSVDYASEDMSRGYGSLEWGGQQYFGAQIPLQVYTS